MTQIAYTLASIHRHTGTITDISALCEVAPDAIMFGPELTDTELFEPLNFGYDIFCRNAQQARIRPA